MKIRIGIVGISGYAGLELVRLVLRHPVMEFVAAMDAGEIGEKPVSEIHPQLRGACDLITFVPDPERIAPLQLDTVFLCTPDKVSHSLVPQLSAVGIRTVDFSGSFRLKDIESYKSWYGFSHENPELLKAAV